MFGSCYASTTQEGLLHLWLDLSNQQENEQWQLLNLLLSTDFLFGPDIQVMIDRLDKARKVSEQVGSHLQPSSQQQPQQRQRYRDLPHDQTPTLDRYSLITVLI